MKIINTRKTLVILFIFVFLQTVAAQESEKWINLQTSDGEFSAFSPAGFLVDREKKNEIEIHSFKDDVKIHLTIEKNKKAKNKLDIYRRFPRPDNDNVSGFKIGNFVGDMRINELEKFYTASFYIASPKAFYTIWISAKSEKDVSLLKFLSSIRLDKQPLIKTNEPTNLQAAETILIESLKTSPVILEALKRKKTEKGQIVFAVENDEKSTVEDTLKYSRPLIILRRPKPSYTDTGRKRNINGEVKIKVDFKADGQIGNITVLNKLDGGLHNQAIEAARKMSFLPAEIEGKPVDVTKVVVYTFTIY